jgi:two-component sensor histidine kinase
VIVSGGDCLLLKAAVGLPEGAGAPGLTTIPAGAGSAMGYALLSRGPVVSTVEAETRFAPSEVVLKSGARSSVNVVIWAGGEPFGILEADSLEPDVFGENDVHFLQLYANLVGAAVDRQRLSSDAAKLTAERELLLKESGHRIKNILAVVIAVAWRTRKDSLSIDAFMQAFSGRINALSRLQDLSLSKGEKSVPLAELARGEIGASGACEGKHYVLRGPSFDCSPSTAQAISLLLYELTTNACKYGALRPDAAPNSRIELSWRIERRTLASELELQWRELSATPLDVSRDSGGFGSELLREGIARMTGGSTELRIHRNGVDCVTRISQPH